VLDFTDGSGGVFIRAWHNGTESAMEVGDAQSAPGSYVRGPALAPGRWVHVAFTYASQKYPVRNGILDQTAADVAYGYGINNITESHYWQDDLVNAVHVPDGKRAVDEERGEGLQAAVKRIDPTLPWRPDLYGGSWMCASTPDDGVYYVVRLLLGGQVECLSNASLVCDVALYNSSRAGCQDSLHLHPRNHTGFRAVPSPALNWTVDFLGVRYRGYASQATYGADGIHKPVLGTKARVEVELAVSMRVRKYKMWCASWRIASCPGAWTLEGSADGVSWSTVDQVQGVAALSVGSWLSSRKQEVVPAGFAPLYAYYRLSVDELAGTNTGDEDGHAFANLDDLELWGEEGMGMWLDGVEVTGESSVDGRARLPGGGASLRLRAGNLAGAVALDDVQWWPEQLNASQLAWLQYT